MIYTTENNWYQYGYNGIQFARRLGANDLYQTFYTAQPNIKFGSFKSELLQSVRSIVDTYPSLKPNLLFSGGLDSELVLRALLEIGVKPTVTIFRYEKDYNIYDVSYAVTICSMLGIDYKLVDFNLEKFYQTDAERISEISQIDRPRALPHCKFIEIAEGLPILGSSDLTVMRTDNDYSKKGTWMVRCWEHDTGWSKFIREIEKPAVAEFFKWSPGIVLSFLNLPWLKKLINDEYYGKLGINSTKIIGYRTAYTTLVGRVKQTGFEKTDHIILEFEKFLEKKYGSLYQRSFFDRNYNELIKEITGQELL